MLANIYGKEQGGIGYLLRNPTARVMRGNPALTQCLMNTYPYCGQRYTSGVISERIDVDSAIMDRAMKELDLQFRAGLPEKSIDFLDIEHTDKGRRERHFIAPHIELITGKRFSPYIDRIDRYRLRAWRELFNLEHGLIDPETRLHFEPDYSRSRLKQEHQDILTRIFEAVKKRISDGSVTSRNEIISFLRSNGHSIRDIAKSSNKPLQQPVLCLPSGEIIRLKGSVIYRTDFTLEMLTPKLDAPTPKAIQTRVEFLKEKIALGMEFRAHHTVGHLFGRTEQTRIERGFSQIHLSQLMEAKFGKLRSELLHPMFGDDQISQTVFLIKHRAQIVANSKIKTPFQAPSSLMKYIEPNETVTMEEIEIKLPSLSPPKPKQQPSKSAGSQAAKGFPDEPPPLPITQQSVVKKKKSRKRPPSLEGDPFSQFLDHPPKTPHHNKPKNKPQG